MAAHVRPWIGRRLLNGVNVRVNGRVDFSILPLASSLSLSLSLYLSRAFCICSRPYLLSLFIVQYTLCSILTSYACVQSSGNA